MGRVGQSVKMAVEKFVSVGESIAEEHGEFSEEMCQACTEARRAGATIQELTESSSDDPQQTKQTSVSEKTAMVRSARQLLSAITRVLIIADKVVIRHVIAAKDKVKVYAEPIRVFNVGISIMKKKN